MFPRLARRVSHATALALLAGAALVGCTPAVVAPSSSSSSVAVNGEESRFVELINAERSRAGLGPLTLNGGAVNVARSWASHLAEIGRLDHNPNLANDVTANVTASWLRIGEDVGSGGDADSVFRALMGSSSHRANILDSGYDILGVGVVRTDSTLWLSLVFVGV